MRICGWRAGAVALASAWLVAGCSDDGVASTSASTSAGGTTEIATGTGSPPGTSTTEDPTTTAGTGAQTTGAPAPVCGDGMVEAPEVCDGTMLDGNTCAKNPPWGGGTLKCSPTCDYFDFSACCLGQGTACELLDDQCCPGLKCKNDMLFSPKCLP